MGLPCMRWKLLFAATILFVSCAAGTGYAREGFYLGYGFVGQTAKGDLDGSTSFLDKAGNKYLLGSLNSGVGSTIVVGYGFNSVFGLELLGASSHHTASFSGQNDTDADVTWGMLGVRLTAPIAKAFELFLRLGESSYSVDYKKYVLLAPGLTQTTDVSYSGFGSAYGGGFEIMGEHFGVEFSYMVHSATLDQAKVSGVSQTTDLPHHLHVPITTSAIAFNYHFK